VSTYTDKIMAFDRWVAESFVREHLEAWCNPRMGNDQLRQALDAAQLDIAALASGTGVDPKTVQRWLSGRRPYARHRRVVAALLDEAESWLWPDAQPSTSELGPRSEIVTAYAYRSELSPRRWWELFTRATQRIDLLGYTLYFLWEQHPRLPALLVGKADAGCAVRLIIADPDCRHVRMRDAEEQAAITLGARVQTTMRYLERFRCCQGIELRTQTAALYNSIFRFDDDMLVTPHLYGTLGHSAPLLHLRRRMPDGLFDRFAEHLDAIVATTTPVFTDQEGMPDAEG
jgi:transcriptional regulator with XRE-family HTH domain